MTATLTTNPTQSQRLEALKLANAERTFKATFKRELSAGDRDPAVILDDAPHSMTVGQYLLSVRGIGPDRLRKFVRDYKINASKRVAALSERERSIVSAALETRCR